MLQARARGIQSRVQVAAMLESEIQELQTDVISTSCGYNEELLTWPQPAAAHAVSTHCVDGGKVQTRTEDDVAHEGLTVCTEENEEVASFVLQEGPEKQKDTNKRLTAAAHSMIQDQGSGHEMEDETAETQAVPNKFPVRENRKKAVAYSCAAHTGEELCATLRIACASSVPDSAVAHLSQVDRDKDGKGREKKAKKKKKKGISLRERRRLLRREKEASIAVKALAIADNSKNVLAQARLSVGDKQAGAQVGIEQACFEANSQTEDEDAERLHLYYASASGDLERVAQLLEEGHDPNARSTHVSPTAHFSARVRTSVLADSFGVLFCSQGFPQWRRGDSNAMHAASYRTWPAEASRVHCTAHVHRTDRHVWFVLVLADGFEAVVARLLEANGDPDAPMDVSNYPCYHSGLMLVL